MKTTQHLVATFSLALCIVSTATVRGQFNSETNNGTITITKYTGPGGDVNIPHAINGLPVATIGEGALYCCTGLTRVTIPDSVVHIGIFAFSGCGSLTSVTIGKGVNYIGGAAFRECSSLTGVYFEGNAASHGPELFDGDNNATVYYLPGTTGWGTTFGDRPTAEWVLPNPLILTTAPHFGIRTNEFGFIISWATSFPVVVEASPSVGTSMWLPVSTNTLTDGWSYFRDAEWSSYPSRFYRIRSQ